MRVLVTGGHGFIGRHLVDLLLGEGAEVRCLSRREATPPALAGREVEVVRGDVRHARSLVGAFRGVEEVYHLAGLTSSLTRRAMVRTNAGGVHNVLVASEAAGVPGRVVLCSSLAAVGPTRGPPLAEDAPCRPLTWYGESKLAGEAIARGWGTILPITILRPPSVYGPGDLAFLPLFRAAARGVALLPGHPAKRYSLVSAADLARAFLAAARSARACGRTYFAGHEEVVTLLGLVRAAEQAVGRRTLRVRLPESAMRLFGQAADLVSQVTGRSSVLGSERMKEVATGDWVCSSRALARDTGWHAVQGLTEGFPETVAWYRRRGWLPETTASGPSTNGRSSRIR